MTAEILDIGILVLIVLSALIGLIRGFVREALSLATWVAAFGFSILYVKPLSEQLPFAVQSEVVRMGIAFAIIFFGVLVVGAIINHLLSTAVSSIGLGGVDHVLGGAFGVLRGGLIITLLVLLMGVTAYPKQGWWKDSSLMPWFESAANTVKDMIPQDFSNYLGQPAVVLPQ
ncbi:MAG: CvpA family protein [Gammaproteobacteria bacterium]|nr:CvpA family protein [Gammaproteobacteria bacterium]MBU1725331.1 CvpA family protein [Gammaproteobacteria bacterium]MBU2004340.1 CvpA family protein [Gammaproteobacteria bacterium]